MQKKRASWLWRPYAAAAPRLLLPSLIPGTKGKEKKKKNLLWPEAKPINHSISLSGCV